MKPRYFSKKMNNVFCVFLLFSFFGFKTMAQYNIVVNGPADICGTNTTYLSLNPTTGALSFAWRKYNVPFGSIYSTSSTLQSPETGYWVCEVMTSNGLVVTSPVLIRTSSLYIESTLGTSSCIGSLLLDENASAVANLNLYSFYTWQKNGVPLTVGANGFTYNATSSGVYTCQAGLSCGFANSNSLNITIESPIPTGTVISASGSTTICVGSSVNLSVPQNSGWTYQWKKNNIAISGGILNSYPATLAGNYTCTISNSCGSFTTSAIAVSITPMPQAAVITASGPTSFCFGGNVILSGNNAGGTWVNFGSSAPSITVSGSGDYYVINSNSCGIVNSNHILVTVNPNPMVSFSGLAASYNCMDAPVTLTGNPSGGTFSGFGVAGNNFNPNTVGTGGIANITYNYTTSAGCSGSSTSSAIVSSVSNCAIPQNVVASQIAKKTAVISWNSSAAPSFKVRYRKAGSTVYLYQNITWTPCNPTFVTLTGLVSNTNYTVDVKSVCGSSSSSYSAPITFKTLLTNPIAINSQTREMEGESTITETSLLTLFPNPVQNELKIKLSAVEKCDWIKIYNSLGELVFAKESLNSEAEFVINTSGWTNGIYFVRALVDGEEINSKLIKN